MVNVAVVSKDEKAVKDFIFCLEKFKEKELAEINLRICKNEKEIINIYNYKYAVVAIDLNQDYNNGFEIAKRLRLYDENVCIILLGSLSQAILGYEVAAIGFLEKPLNASAAEMYLSRALKRCVENDKNLINISITGCETKRINVNHIKYIEVYGHQLVYHLTTGEIHATGQLYAVEQQLEHYGFYRCNKSTIINFAYLTSYKAGVVCLGDVEFVVSRRKKKELEDLVTIYFNKI